ncbi:MAG: hypothetical protein WC817_00955 [Patescibacteria group bacterium]|jgi:hypothetical protein
MRKSEASRGSVVVAVLVVVAVAVIAVFFRHWTEVIILEPSLLDGMSCQRAVVALGDDFEDRRPDCPEMSELDRWAALVITCRANEAKATQLPDICQRNRNGRTEYVRLYYGEALSGDWDDCKLRRNWQCRDLSNKECLKAGFDVMEAPPEWCPTL